MKGAETWTLSLSECMQLKGIALLLLLWHHLFYAQNGLYDDVMIHGHGFVQETALACKVCVAIFVFLSGYGLGAQYREREMDVLKFYKRRFTKLYTNYWLIWLLFVPAGLLFFGRTADVVYGNHIWQRMLINIFGLQDYFGFLGYNATWWFMSCIIGLYLIFPFYLLLEKRISHLPLLIVAFFLWNDIPHMLCLTNFILSFVVGLYLSRYKLLFVNKIGGGVNSWRCCF